MSSPEPSRILKSHDFRSLESKIAFNYEDIRRRCDDYVEKVRRETRQMIRRAHADAEATRQRAEKEGREAGRRQGLRDAEQQIAARATELADQKAAEMLKTALPALNAAVEAVSRERDRWLAEWEAASIRLSVAIAEKLLRQQLVLHPNLSRQMLSETLELAAGTPRITLRMNSADIESLGAHAEEIVRSMASCGEAAVVADETISRGGCVIETQHGVIDARLETQLERIASELLQTCS